MSLTTQNLSEILSAAIEIALAAGEKITEIYRQKAYTAAQKADQSPVTCADLAADKIITTHLSEVYSKIPILSEESNNPPYAERQMWEYYWLIDPLDGTREFINHSPEFTVNIALMRHNQPLLGVITAPMLDIYYYALSEDFAYKVSHNQTARIHCRKANLHNPVITTSVRHNHNRNLQKFLEQFPQYSLITKGSSLKSCLVAEGVADIYPRFGETSEWDTAAAQAIVHAAGGVICDLQGQPLLYNKERLINPDFMVMTEGTQQAMS